MSRSWRFRRSGTLAVAPLAALLMAGCGDGADQAGESADTSRRYPLRGRVEAVDLEGGALRVAHEKIPGYMDAMTMRFPVLDREVLASVHEGDELTGTLVVGADNRYWLEEITLTARAEPAPAPTDAPPDAPVDAPGETPAAAPTEP